MYSPSEYEIKMFQEMEGKYVSENEKVFFETMKMKNEKIMDLVKGVWGICYFGVGCSGSSSRSKDNNFV